MNLRNQTSQQVQNFDLKKSSSEKLKRKYFRIKKIIPPRAMFGLIVLVVASVGAVSAFILSKSNQDIRQQASGGATYASCADDTPDGEYACAGTSSDSCKICKNGDFEPAPGECPSTLQCGAVTPTPTITPTPSLTTIPTEISKIDDVPILKNSDPDGSLGVGGTQASITPSQTKSTTIETEDCFKNDICPEDYVCDIDVTNKPNIKYECKYVGDPTPISEEESSPLAELIGFTNESECPEDSGLNCPKGQECVKELNYLETQKGNLYRCDPIVTLSPSPITTKAPEIVETLPLLSELETCTLKKECKEKGEYCVATEFVKNYDGIQISNFQLLPNERIIGTTYACIFGSKYKPEEYDLNSYLDSQPGKVGGHCDGENAVCDTGLQCKDQSYCIPKCPNRPSGSCSAENSLCPRGILDNGKYKICKNGEWKNFGDNDLGRSDDNIKLTFDKNCTEDQIERYRNTISSLEEIMTENTHISCEKIENSGEKYIDSVACGNFQGLDPFAVNTITLNCENSTCGGCQGAIAHELIHQWAASKNEESNGTLIPINETFNKTIGCKKRDDVYVFKEEPPRAYGATNCGEALTTSHVFFLIEPCTMEKKYPRQYDFWTNSPESPWGGNSNKECKFI